MGALKERVHTEMKQAMKDGDKVKLDTLRLLHSAVKNKEVEVRRELSDEELQAVAATEAKRRREAAEAYEEGGAADRAEKERAELAVLETFLPEQLSDGEVDALVEEAISATGASGPGDVGKVMGAVMGKAKGQVDGNVVSAKVRERLGD